MPCYDPRDNGPHTEYVDVKVNGCTAKELDAILCGVLDVDRAKLKPGVMLWDLVDWEEVGLPRAVAERWHKRHRETDAMRKRVEAQERERKRLHRDAIRKLSVEERRVLGIRD